MQVKPHSIHCWTQPPDVPAEQPGTQDPAHGPNSSRTSCGVSRAVATVSSTTGKTVSTVSSTHWKRGVGHAVSADAVDGSARAVAAAASRMSLRMSLLLPARAGLAEDHVAGR